MKAEVRIPKGWRKLKVGELQRSRDRILDDGCWDQTLPTWQKCGRSEDKLFVDTVSITIRKISKKKGKK